MKSTKLNILCLVAALTTSALAGEGRRLPVHGQWDDWNPNQFNTDMELDVNHSYLISNNTGNTIYVMLVQDWTPLDYFPVASGGSVQFEAPWNLAWDTYGLALFTDEIKLNGNSVVVREMPEFVTD